MNMIEKMVGCRDVETTKAKCPKCGTEMQICGDEQNYLAGIFLNCPGCIFYLDICCSVPTGKLKQVLAHALKLIGGK